MRIVFDIEGNGLYHDITKIHCISTLALESHKGLVESFYDINRYTPTSLKESRSDSLSGALKRLYEAEELIGHNIINYDIPVLKKLYGWTPNENTKITDTLVMSRVQYPDRPKPSGYTGKGGPHSLECWGYRVGKGKPDHKDWSVFSADMLQRNREDVAINLLTYNKLIEEGSGWDWSRALELEHAIARIITEQEHHGVLFDTKRAKEYVQLLQDKMDEIDREVVPRLPPEIKQRGVTVSHPFNKTGIHSKRYGEDISFCSGPFTRIDIQPFNIGSISKVKDYLLANGWIPDVWNFSKTTGERASPRLEGEFEGVVGDLPRRVRDRIRYRHRKSQIEGWINNVDNNNRIPAGGNPCGTNTGRFTHTKVVNVPKANVYTREHYESGLIRRCDVGSLIWTEEHQKDFFGSQMRSLFKVPEGFKMVGHDAKGLELRVLAHYMDDPEFTEVLLTGDIHEYNRERAGLPTRDDAKTFIYAFLYGAGDTKIGNIIGGTGRDGKEIKRNFFKSLPKLERLIRSVRTSSSKGYLKGIDGRKIWLRRAEDGEVMGHKALNTLIQCTGSLIMKNSSVILWDSLLPKTDVTAYKVIDMHDESQAEVLEKDVELYSELAVRSLKMSGEDFKLKVPMEADVKVGNNWAETH